VCCGMERRAEGDSFGGKDLGVYGVAVMGRIGSLPACRRQFLGYWSAGDVVFSQSVVLRPKGGKLTKAGYWPAALRLRTDTLITFRLLST
jgi:hypothetical protein